MENQPVGDLDKRIAQLKLSLVDGRQLFALSDVLAENYQLRSMLSDPALTVDARSQLITKLFTAQLSSNALKAVQLLSQSAASARQLVDNVERAVVRSILIDSQALLEVQDELFRCSRLIQSHSDLQNTLRDDSYSIEARAELITKLIGTQCHQVTLLLVKRAIQTGDEIVQQLINYVELAAQIQNHKTAIVTSATELTDEQKQQIASQLHRIYGYTVDIQSNIDQRILGGVRIKIGDDEIDGSILRKIEQAKSQIG